ncbi:MAG: putative bifunctional diguanylate cyclase/phosphodiesterase, partial [Noviherbaspirillum sp.]
EITRRIRSELTPADFVARFGGDEFVVLADATVAEAEAKANAMLHALSQPLAVGDTLVKLQASIGIAQLSAAHRAPLDLVRDADAAMFQAKERGRNRVALFDASLQRRTTRRAQMDGALRFALERNELSLVYQAKVGLKDGALKGFEQLMRWNSPQYGDISPEDFIPIAESSGLVVPIGLWALEQACRQLCAWRERYEAARGLSIAVNVSMRQLLQPSFRADVAAILKRTGIDPAGIQLELTETSAMANPQQSMETLSHLKELGLRVALDDFGTGHSSLAYLQKLPIDVIKIDKAFIPGLSTNLGDRAIVRLILTLAATLGLDSVAEGVESAAQVEALIELGCDQGQGFLFSAPLPPEQAERLIPQA